MSDEKVQLTRTSLREGGETWHINANGESRTVRTSATSAKALDKAMVRFDAALKRLADR